MADPMTQSVKQVLQALEVFSGKPDRESLEKANTWLQQFQHSPDSWPTCNVLLLSPDVPDAGRTFAAQTFRAKVTHDLEQLDPTQRVGLRATLMSALERYAAGPRAVLIQVCLALSGLALQMKEWDGAVMDVINALGQNPATVLALLQFLTVLPEEVSGNTRIPMSNEDYRIQESRLLSNNAVEIMKLLTIYSQAAGVTPAVRSQIFRCLRSWILAGDLTPAMIGETPLFQLAFDGLAWDEIFDSAVDVICCYIHETQEIDDNMPSISAVVNNLIVIRPSLTAAIQADDSDKVRGLCRIFVEAGETYRLLLLQHPETFYPIVEAITECVAYSDLEIAPITFHFWFRLAQSIGKKPDVPPLYLNTYRTLLELIIAKLHFPANPESMTPQERDEFRSFRHVMGDTLKDCCYVLGTEGCLMRTYEMITTAMAKGATGAANISWQEIEAPLFSMRSMGAEVNPDDDEIIPKIMDLIPQLPPHPRVQYAVIMVISRYTEWTDRHPSYIPFQLSFISAGFEDPDPEVAAASGQAMKYMCKDCRQHLVPYLPQLHTFVQTMGSKLIQDDKIQVYEAIAYVITSMPMEEAGETLRLFTLDLITRVHAIASNATATKDELAAVADNLECLEALLHVIKSFGEDLPAACQATAVEYYGVMDTLIAKHGSQYFLAERVSRILRLGMHFFGEGVASLVPPLLSRTTAAFNSTGFSSYLWLLGKTVISYGSSTNVEIQTAIQSAFTSASSQVFAMLKVQTPADIPDVVEDYIHFMLIMSEVCPSDLILSSAFGGGFQVCVTSLSMIQPEIIFPAMELIRSTVGHSCMRPSTHSQLSTDERRFEPIIRQVVSAAGFQLIGIILTGLVSHFPDDAVFLVVDVMSSLVLSWSTELPQWLPPVVEQLPSSSVPPAAKTQFLSDFAKAISSREVDNVKSAVLTLYRASRKTRERSQDLGR